MTCETSKLTPMVRFETAGLIVKEKFSFQQSAIGSQ